MKRLTIVLVILITFSCFFTISGEENTYVIKNKGEIIETFASLKEANKFYNAQIDNYENLELYENEQLLEVEYGTVEFKKEKISYTDLNGEILYVDGNLFSDGAYLLSRNNNVYFKVSGTIGYTDKNNVVLHSFDEGNLLSKYVVKDDVLYHLIKTDFESSYYKYSLKLDEKPNELKQGDSYYSYDGHYFYDDYYKMIDDYKKETFENSINKNAYYNYYQYLPFRSVTNYSYDELNSYIEDVLGINGKIKKYEDLDGDLANDLVNKSQLYNEIKAFLTSQELYGINALELLSISLVESSYGKNEASFYNNNLFTNAAFNFKQENKQLAYDSLNDSVYAYAKYYLNDRYASYGKTNYRGGFFGDKYSGMNVKYSSDPYLGEKFASMMYNVDCALGSKDKNDYCLGISNQEKVVIYQNKELNKALMTLRNASNYSFVIIGQSQDFYKIQLEQKGDNYLYDFDNQVAYIKKDVISSIINENKIKEKVSKIVEYDFNGGSVNNNQSVKFKVNNEGYVMDDPLKEGYEFLGFEKKDEDKYQAEYKQISSIEVNSPSKYYDFTNLRMLIKYADGQSRYKDVNSEDVLVKEVDNKTTYYFDYCGLTFEKEVETTKEENKRFSFNEIRELDNKQNKTSDIKIIIKDDKYDTNISGLNLALDSQTNNRNKHLFEDTFYVNVEDVKTYKKTKIEKFVSGYNLKPEEYINLSIRKNLVSIDIVKPIVVSVRIDNKDNNRIYTVYHYKENGDIEKCKTVSTDNYVQFIANELGDYVILSLDSFNEYNIEDYYENKTILDNGFDWFKFEMEVLIIMSMIVFNYISACIYFMNKKAFDKEDITAKKRLNRMKAKRTR